MIKDFKPGESVKINPNVYEFKWDGWEELYDKYGHHNGTVDRVIDMSDVKDSESLIIVKFPCDFNRKVALKPDYVWSTEIH